MAIQKSYGTKITQIINGGTGSDNGLTLPVTVDVSELDSFKISSTATQYDSNIDCLIANDTISFN